MAQTLEMADKECASLWQELSLGYTHQRGHPVLLQQIAEGYTVVGPHECNVVVPAEGILLGALALLEPQDRVVVTSPCYQSLYEARQRARSPQYIHKYTHIRGSMFCLSPPPASSDLSGSTVVRMSNHTMGTPLQPGWKPIFRCRRSRGDPLRRPDLALSHELSSQPDGGFAE